MVYRPFCAKQPCSRASAAAPQYQPYKLLLFLLLTGWCLLFLRCESTEKSMVRAVYLAQIEQGYQAGLLYQAPQAAADAAEASGALQFVQAEGQTMERALAAAEQALPQTASYRLCDYLLLPKAEEPLLTEYEQLVLRRGCGRTAAARWQSSRTSTCAFCRATETVQRRMPMRSPSSQSCRVPPCSVSRR